MRGRVAALFAAAALVFAGLGALAPGTAQAGTCTKGACSWVKPKPAQKRDHADLDVKKTTCKTFGDDGAGACLDVYYHYYSGGGITINHVYLRVTGGFWEATAADCNNVRMWNQDSVIKWRKDGNECDVPRNLKYAVFAPNREMPDASSATVGWTFNANLDGEVDQDVHLSITV